MGLYETMCSDMNSIFPNVWRCIPMTPLTPIPYGEPYIYKSFCVQAALVACIPLQAWIAAAETKALQPGLAGR